MNANPFPASENDRPRVYVAGRDGRAVLGVSRELALLGCLVGSPFDGPQPSDAVSVDDLCEIVAEDMAAMRRADVVAVMPDAAGLAVLDEAHAYGVPTAHADLVLALARRGELGEVTR